MVSMERELNKLFNDTNYNKENVIIREIWSMKLELQNFFWGVYNQRVGSSIPSSAYAPRQGILDTIVSFNPGPHFTKFWYQW